MSNDPVRNFSHVAICVSNLDASKAFYCEALGCVHDHDVQAGEPYGKLVELNDFAYRASFLQRDGVMIELLKIDRPGHVGPAERRPMNQLGVTHLSFVVDDLEATCDRIEKHGGSALTETKVGSPFGDIIFCTDPDGTRIELWEKTD